MKKSPILFPIVALALLLGILSSQGYAAMEEYGFVCATTGIPADVETQFTVEVTDEGVAAGQVLFKFSNVGDIASSVTDVYFRDGTLLGISDLIDINQNAPTWLGWGNSNDLPVDFSIGPVSPPYLPGGGTLGFRDPTATFFATDSDDPIRPNGVGLGESLGVVFNLLPDKDIESVFTALALGNRDGGLRIGLKVQGIGPADLSGVFLNIVPVPAAFLLGALGLGVAGLKLRKRA